MDETTVIERKLAEHHFDNFISLTLRGDWADANGYPSYGRQLWFEAMECLDEAYAVLETKPPDSGKMWSALKEAGVMT